MMWAKENRTDRIRMRCAILAAALVVLVALLAGCESDEDCLNCVEIPPPVVPTGVHSISGDNWVLVQWYDISYAPYDETVVEYEIFSRLFEEGDQDDPDRLFDRIGVVAWDENFDESSGLHWFYDDYAENGLQYEYAVRSVNAAGVFSALSFEFVIDAPLPMSPYVNGNYLSVGLADGEGFNFEYAAANQGIIDAGVVDPVSGTHDIQVLFENGFPYVVANDLRFVVLQDFGVFTDNGQIFFEGVSWAPADGYSQTGKIELVSGHIYVVEIQAPSLHYAKFGVTGTYVGSVSIIWAYQTIPELPELKAPDDVKIDEGKPQIVSF